MRAYANPIVKVQRIACARIKQMLLHVLAKYGGFCMYMKHLFAHRVYMQNSLTCGRLEHVPANFEGFMRKMDYFDEPSTYHEGLLERCPQRFILSSNVPDHFIVCAPPNWIVDVHLNHFNRGVKSGKVML